MTRLIIVVAATKANGIGQNGQLPWKLSKELKYFAQATSSAPEGKQNAVIMGRTTWESIPPKFRPLPNRLNIVLSRNLNYDLSAGPGASALLVRDLESALEYVDNQKPTEKPVHRGFIIGGASLYSEVYNLSPSAPTVIDVDRLLLTRVLSPEFDGCDAFMPDFLKQGNGEEWTQASHTALQTWLGFQVPEGVQEEKGITYEFQMWTRNGGI